MHIALGEEGSYALCLLSKEFTNRLLLDAFLRARIQSSLSRSDLADYKRVLIRLTKLQFESRLLIFNCKPLWRKIEVIAVFKSL